MFCRHSNKQSRRASFNPLLFHTYSFVCGCFNHIPKLSQLSPKCHPIFSQLIVLTFYKSFAHLCFLPMGYFCSSPKRVCTTISLGLLGTFQLPPTFFYLTVPTTCFKACAIFSFKYVGYNFAVSHLFGNPCTSAIKE